MSHIGEDHWNASLYDRKHAFVSEYGNDLVTLLAPQKGEAILDVGCGTGDLANTLVELGVEVTGIDQSENMIQQASTKYPHIPFVVKNVLNLEFNNKFHAIFSNATLHWVKRPQVALNKMYNSLKTGGRFVAEFGGQGNVKLITDELINQLNLEGISYTDEQFPWYFPSIGEYSTLMEEAGFRVVFAQHFDRPTPLEGENGLRNWMDMFAGNLLASLTEDTRERIIFNVENKLKKDLYKDGQWIADYKRLRVFGLKEAIS
ncbi:methyltransferase domain-containing protein [Radiobacillus kanasensis]|uniref:class I SAM-dependent methyltransferase n=1 Tax=Radiobacillus kanasensis TaxID=2844358 RepID=UPI001E49EE13|nr:class I SAM-dependent methyltransferase [Radiobacillus kanasensis]UFT99270.1 methyltransferase domain-containing protein [Radiobacillus kanasensis]